MTEVRWIKHFPLFTLCESHWHEERTFAGPDLCQDLRQAEKVNTQRWQFTWNSYAESSENYMEVALAELYLQSWMDNYQYNRPQLITKPHHTQI